MPKLTLDGKQIEFTNQKSVLQAALDAGVEIPHYCYHPGLSVPASCRICLVEVEGIPKLVPACYTPPRDGMVVHAQSTKAVANQKQVMEFLLINHPLDCPVCDKAGECGLQDYSYGYGRAESRFEEDKSKNPKKDIGEHLLLYSDRCIMCTRCVRFTREVSGTAELLVEGRGHKEEIDIFPGKPVNNKLSLNVIDICPVGALLDKEFLFKQRVWMLKRTASISPVDAGGENIWIEQNENTIHRIKPRYNADVNQWWISNDTRHSYQAIGREDRLTTPTTKKQGSHAETSYRDAVRAADDGLRKLHRDRGNGSVYAVLSPMMSCEEAYLLAKYVRSIDPQALLVVGPTPLTADETFNHYLTKKETFKIQGEKVPNRKGVERVIAMLGGPGGTWADFLTNACNSKAAGGWIVGGYLSKWISARPAGATRTDEFVVLQDVLPSVLSESADVVLPGAMWAEKDGCWENHAGRIQAFEKAIDPPGLARCEAEIYLKLSGREPKFVAADIRKEMGDPFTNVAIPSTLSTDVPAMDFAEL
jgi:NADH-quinone oxidoreductase subunit G